MATSTSIEWTSPRLGPIARWFLIRGQLILAAVFVFAAYTKLHFDDQWHLHDYRFFFAMTIDSYHLLPLWTVELMARFLPWFEMLLGLMLFFGLWVRWAAAATTGLISVFVFAIVRAYLLHLDISCGCFGNNERLTGWTIVRDACFLVLSFAVTWLAFAAHRRAARRN
jgi:putative oxidoreductase